MKRLLDCTAADFAHMDGRTLFQAIKASEGRVVLAEVIGVFQPLFPPGVSNAEIVAAFGADMVLFNLFDLFQPLIHGIETEQPEEVVRRAKQLIGRPVGVNLEPVDLSARALEQLVTLPEGRTPTKKTLEKVKQLGFDFICLTGNPKTGVTNEQITRAIRLVREVLGTDILLIAGKMHGAGVAGESSEDIFSQEAIQAFIEAGADIILLPAPGTVPGITVSALQEQVAFIHQQGALVMTTIGTSQEGADEQTIRQIALNAKMAGADVHHLGDAGYHGISVPENILAYSIAIRGKRHTYRRMASSPLR